MHIHIRWEKPPTKMNYMRVHILQPTMLITEMDLKGILICGSLPIASNCKHYNWAHRWLVVRPSKKLKKTIEHGKAVVRLGC
jgi:hypothetical protein